jgi:DNA-binding beta-propeller fold protein YncE
MNKNKAFRCLLFTPFLVAILCLHFACKKTPTSPGFKDLTGGTTVTSGTGTATPTPMPGGGGTHAFVKQWGSQGVSVGQFQSPHCIAVDDLSRLYVSDYGNSRVQVFKQDGSAVTQWSATTPQGVAVDNGYNVYVANETGNAVYQYLSLGSSVQTFSPPYGYVVKWWDGAATQTCSYLANGPIGTATDDNGNLYLSNSVTNSGVCAEGVVNFYSTISRRDHSSNIYQELWRTAYSSSDKPMGVAVDSLRDFVYFVDGFNHKLVQLDLSTWNPAHVPPILPNAVTIGTQGSGNYQFQYPHGVCVNRNTGHVFVADTSNHRIMEYDSALVYVGQFGSEGTGAGSFKSPWGMASDLDGYIYVVDSDNHRVQKFAP